MVKCSSDTDKAHISESSATVIVVLLLLQYHCPPNLELHQHISRACAGQFLVFHMDCARYQCGVNKNQHIPEKGYSIPTKLCINVHVRLSVRHKIAI